MADLLQTLITAVSIGSLYALIALGYTMVYGILKFINFAHSDVVVLGGWISYTLAIWMLPLLGVDVTWAPFWAGGLVLLLTMAICGGIGFLIERLAYKPLRRAPRLNVLITAIGVSLFLQNAGQLQWNLGGNLKLPFGTQPQGMPRLLPDRALNDWAVQQGVVGDRVQSATLTLDSTIPISLKPEERYRIEIESPKGPPRVLSVTGWKSEGERTIIDFLPALDLPPTPTDRFVLRQVAKIPITLVDVTIVVTAAILMVALQILVYRTKLGVAMRAVSFNPETAAIMGVPVNRVISFTFVTGAMLAAAAGFLYAVKYTTLQQPAHAGWVLLGLKAFVAAVVGGIGNIRGAVLGGFLIAFIEQFGARYISSEMRDVYVFAVLILVLLLRPQGILGSPMREKV